MRDLNRRPGVGLQASPGPPSALRFNPSDFRRRTGHGTAPPSRNFTKGLECLEGLESLVLAFPIPHNFRAFRDGSKSRFVSAASDEPRKGETEMDAPLKAKP